MLEHVRRYLVYKAWTDIFNGGKQIVDCNTEFRPIWKKTGLRPSACWDRGFESHRGHRCFVVPCLFCQVEADRSSRGVLPTVMCASM
jgi:hypothetical protein